MNSQQWLPKTPSPLSTPCPVRSYPAEPLVADRVSTGCSRSPSPILCPTQCVEVPGSVDSWKPRRLGMSTGRHASLGPRKSLSNKLRKSSVSPVTLNSQEATQRLNMYSKKTQESPEPSLNLELDPSIEVQENAGSESGNQPYPGLLSMWRRRLEFAIIGLSDSLRQTMVSQLEWSELYECSGVLLELESLSELGKKLEWKLTVR